MRNAQSCSNNRIRKYSIFVSTFILLASACVSDSSSGGGDNSESETPPGITQILFEEKFDDNSLASRDWFGGTSATISTSNTISGSSGSLEFAWPSGAILPTNGGGKRKLFNPTESVYFRFYMKVSSGWQGSGVSYHPHLFLLLTTEDDQWIGPAETHLTFYLEPFGPDGKILVAFQDSLNIDDAQIGIDLTPGQPNHTEFRGTGGCNGTTDGVVGDCYNKPPWRNGKKYKTTQGYIDNTFKKVEVLVKLNTLSNGVGQQDGIIRVWIEDVKVLGQTNVILRTNANPSMKFNQILIGPYIGVGSPVAQTLWIDELLVATDRIE
ncbi:MAG: hypothetical protein OEV07_11215 [Gammaproteobacteria bacterium]|nr:hypothetical protein [Gammaproteobacteria bacterium]